MSWRLTGYVFCNMVTLIRDTPPLKGGQSVRSRSEAAALFIREGLKVRAEELERLRDALREVEDAKRRLREKARGVLGDDRPE